MKLAELRSVDRHVYEAAEDSALLASIATDLVGSDDRVLDVGTGSGHVGARIAAATGAAVVGSDINPHACRRARENGLEAVRGDLTAPFAADAFDVVTFNPPYLPIPDVESTETWHEAALSGGESGRVVIESFIDDVGRVVAPGGFVLLLASSLTDIEAIAAYAAGRGWNTVAVADVPYPGETLTVLKLVR